MILNLNDDIPAVLYIKILYFLVLSVMFLFDTSFSNSMGILEVKEGQSRPIKVANDQGV